MPYHPEHNILIFIHQRLLEKLLQMLIQSKVDHHLDRILVLSLAISPSERYGGSGLSRTKSNRIQAGVVPRRPLVRPNVSVMCRFDQFGRVSGFLSAASCSASGSLRSSRHTGALSKGMALSNDSSELIHRLASARASCHPQRRVSHHLSKNGRHVCDGGLPRVRVEPNV